VPLGQVRSDRGSLVMSTYVPDVKTKHRAVEAVESALIQRIRVNDGVSRIELARDMGLAPSTIGQYVDRLIGDGVLREGRKSQSASGRPPTILELNPRLGHFVGVDFEARQISATAIDFSQESLERRREKLQANDSAESVIEKINRIVYDVASGGPRLLGIGIGVPGTFDVRRGVAVHYEFIPDWREIPLVELLTRKFRVPIYLENNIRAMALAEKWFGRARYIENFVCLGIRTGVGAGVVIDGKLQCGPGNLAGEIGGWPCPASDDVLNHRSTQTLEQKVSVRAITRKLAAAARDGADTSLKVNGNRGVTVSELLRAARADDPLVLSVLRQAAEYVGRAICQINLLLNTELFIIAGPLAKLDDAFLVPIREVVERLTPRLHGRVPQIEASQIGEFAGALGAAALALHHWTPAR